MARARSTPLPTTSTVQAFGGALPPTMPSADFCAVVRPPYDDLSPVAGTQRRPPEVRPTAFTARPPDLPPRPLMTVDFAINCSLVRPGRPHYAARAISGLGQGGLDSAAIALICGG